MFTVYFSQKLSSLAKLLIHLQQTNPNPDPFQQETVLVQSAGMAQWLQMQIAEQTGVAGNVQFPFPTSFIWQQYRLLFPELPKENIFEKDRIVWRLIRLIPNYLDTSEFAELKRYLSQDDQQYQIKLYQLANKIADLFDQYLVYRPHWLIHWESDEVENVLDEILNSINKNNINKEEVLLHVKWQAILWRELVNDIKLDSDNNVFIASHRAYLQEIYSEKLDKLTEEEKEKLPKRIFVFGISTLPATQLALLKRLSEFCEVHLFFLNPSKEFWGESIEDVVWEKLALKQKISQDDLEKILIEQGNQLLTMWGKQGREFLAQLMEAEPNNILEVFDPYIGESNLIKVKNAILDFNNEQEFSLNTHDDSVQIHSCHSIIREVEVLHNQLLNLFEKKSSLLPKDIIVMTADINKYAPYINAVFSRYKNGDKRYIPFSISDQKATVINPIITSFLTLLNFKESNFNAESVLDLLNINAIRDCYQFKEQDISVVRDWIGRAGVRAGLNINQRNWKNYNAWENGLTRLLLGSALKENAGIWQEVIAFNESYGLSANLVGYLAKFIENLTAWYDFIQEEHSISSWKEKINQLISDFYQESDESLDFIFLLNETLDEIVEKIESANFVDQINIEIIALLFDEKLSQKRNELHFLVGKVNFCTLLPMRAIPFKVVCLLGMNEADFPRKYTVNNFDLMQYAPKKGDRARKDDDRYLFLEALLSAQEVFYVSYIGQSMQDNKEYLPSILVSQLLDYFTNHLAEENAEDFLQKIIRKQPLTVFSQKNFIDGNISYDKEWLATQNQSEQIDFLNIENLNQEQPTEIDLESLIKFISEPVKYFFNQHLGIYFRNYDESIDESEKFLLDSLDNYQLTSQLIEINPEEREVFFARNEIKGNLPLSNFAKVPQQAIMQNVDKLRAVILPYLGESKLLAVDKFLNINGLKINLFCNIQNLFDKEIVFWKVTKLKDKDYIRFWIYFLMLKSVGSDISLKIISLNKDKVEVFQFNSISQEQAEEQLSVYVSDYLASFKKLKWGVSENLETYFKELPSKDDCEGYCAEMLQTLLRNKYSDNYYLNRIFQQSSELNYAEIHQTTLQWFKLMQDSCLIQK